MSWFSRIANVFRPERTTTDVDEELRFHLEQRIADLVSSGVPQHEAELMARRQLGNTASLRESIREAQSVAWLESIARDFRFGLRLLLKNRVTNGATIASLAIAIGACTTAFALIDALSLRPLPVTQPAQLVSLARISPAFVSPANEPAESDGFSYEEYELFRRTVQNDADLFAMALQGKLQTAEFGDGERESENSRIDWISGNGFGILGAKPRIGRLIELADDSASVAEPAAVLSEGFWKRRFGGNPAALGQWVTIGRKHYRIVGVAAAPFTGVEPGYRTDIWIPLSAAADEGLLTNPMVGVFKVWARTHAGIDRSRLREPLQAASKELVRERFQVNRSRNLSDPQIQQLIDAPILIRDASAGLDSLFRYQFRRPFWITGLICALLLLLACSNVANLMMARGSARAAEMALRASLGAARSRLIQQMLIECGQLAAISGVLAVVFAAVVAPAIVLRLGPPDFPAYLNVVPDSRTLIFAAALTLVSVVLFGLMPAVRASAALPGITLKSSRGGPLRWMLAAQIGFSVAVLFLSGLLLLSFRKLINVELGFVGKDVVLLDLDYRDPQIGRRNSGVPLLDRLRELPAVRGAGISAQRLIGGEKTWIMLPFVRFSGRDTEMVRPRDVQVSAGFFDAMKIRWIAGRDFQPQEISSDSESVIVNQAFVDKFFAGRDPLGKTFEKLTDDPEPITQRIIGVVANFRYNNLREPEVPSIYTPLQDINGATLNIRTASDAATQMPALRKAVETAAPDLMINSTVLLDSQVANALLIERLLAILSGFFSTVALLLAGIGLYGVVNYSAVRRTREIGVRVALGAQRITIVRMMVADVSAPMFCGLLFGVGSGLGLARFVASQLFGVSATDFWSLAAPLACVAVVSIAAVLPPALRAANADPLIALRQD